MLRQLAVATKDDRVRVRVLEILAKSDLCVVCRERDFDERSRTKDHDRVVFRLTLAQRTRLHELLDEIAAIKAAARKQPETWDPDRMEYTDRATFESGYVPPSEPSVTLEEARIAAQGGYVTEDAARGTPQRGYRTARWAMVRRAWRDR